MEYIDINKYYEGNYMLYLFKLPEIESNCSQSGYLRKLMGIDDYDKFTNDILYLFDGTDDVGQDNNYIEIGGDLKQLT